MLVLLDGGLVFDGPVADYVSSEPPRLLTSRRGRGCSCARTCSSCGARRVLLGVLIAYPLVIALLVGLAAAYANAKPRVAFVDQDGIPTPGRRRRQRFDVDDTITTVGKNVELVRMSAGARRRGSSRRAGSSPS